MATATLSSDLLTAIEAAEFIGVQVQTLAVWRTSGRYDLPFIKVGRLIKYRRSDLEKWLADRTATQTG